MNSPSKFIDLSAHGTPWTTDEVDRLVSEFHNGKSIRDLQALCKRTFNAIVGKLTAINVIKYVNGQKGYIRISTGEMFIRYVELKSLDDNSSSLDDLKSEDEIVAQWNKGMSLLALSKKFKVSRRILTNYLTTHNLAIKIDNNIYSIEHIKNLIQSRNLTYEFIREHRSPLKTDLIRRGIDYDVLHQFVSNVASLSGFVEESSEGDDRELDS